MNKKKKKELEKKAVQLRITGLKMVQTAQSGHIGGAFSLSEILSVLYFDKMNVDPKHPHAPDRDRLVLSKGHATVALYPALACRGFFPLSDLDSFRNINGHMSGHAEIHVPGVDISTGSLGQGLSCAVGLALAEKHSKLGYHTYAILGDGEIQEGQIWEACMFAAAQRLDNLTAILDSNKVQLDGSIKEILDTGDLAGKFESFGFHVQSIDGHDVEAISNALDLAESVKDKPSMIIANTIKGKGVSFMEGKSEWHGKTPNEAEFKLAFQELEEAYHKLEE